MICQECENKIKSPILDIETKCFKCGKSIPIKHTWRNICLKCSNNLLVCQCCGKKIKKKEKIG